ncbi:MAG: ribulokinase [Planctomycetes bacterium GWF2_41_51]|nr:MAG: ribulokinase [Planctomycetes bacterium GWF2_41_51]HBG26867.1 ribulokinase [Phycisphaerales bacterium]
MAYTIGLDYGTNSVRCVVVNTKNGDEIAASVVPYPSGKNGIILDHSDANLARQNPADYILGIEVSVNNAIINAKTNDKKFSPEKIIGFGVDTTGSTPIPVDSDGTPLSMLPAFKNNPNAMAWLWKDHTSHKEAAQITALAKKMHPEYLAKCGGTYSSEWFFSKILHCLNIDKKVFDAAYSWVECADYIPAVLVGDTKPENLKCSRCAAGHKAMFNEDWGGLPAKSFLSKLNPKLGALRDRLYKHTYSIDTIAGGLSKQWANKLGLIENIPVAVGAFDAHLGAVGSGVKNGTLVKIIGTSTCDILVSQKRGKLKDIPGVCGIVDGSVLPNFWGLEAGQSAVGDIFNWYVDYIQPGGKIEGSHEELTKKAAKLKPAQSGLLALDWNNGNRTILVDQRLTGLLLGQTLHTKPEEIYRALIEATAFGALTIFNRFEEYGVKINEVINCGGIAEKNPMVMQIYADITGREMKVSRSSQSCALGSAIAAAVVAGKKAGGYDDFASAQKAMCGVKKTTYKPIAKNNKVYSELYKLYKKLHDAFGIKNSKIMLSDIMKELLRLKEEANK